MVVQRGDAHARDFRQLFDSQRPGIVRPDPRDRFCRSMALVPESRNGSQARPFGRTEDSIDNLALNQAA
jgi:hypothetical protein